jgi:hypothetical protein
MFTLKIQSLSPNYRPLSSKTSHYAALNNKSEVKYKRKQNLQNINFQWLSMIFFAWKNDVKATDHKKYFFTLRSLSENKL